MVNTLTVSALNLYVKSLLDEDINLCDIYVQGEISNFVNHYKSGHYYFSLKDDKSLIKVVMFSSYNKQLSIMPENGMNVIVRGKVTLYERDGTYQLYATEMTMAGVGLRYLALEKLKEKLYKEGLFDESKKKALPAFPFTVGVATSVTGAAIKDIISVAQRRFPCARILVAPCGVQGDNAKSSIIKAIKNLDKHPEVEVIIIARGGGSKEDMWIFNDEDIARAAFACKKPTVSAVGHEIDQTILDYVCDKRTATPTAGAEIVFPDINSVNYRLAVAEQNITDIILSKLNNEKTRLNLIINSQGFNNVRLMCSKNRDLLNAYHKTLNRQINDIIQNKSLSLSHIADKINSNNPIENLKKGYSLVYKDSTLLTDDVEVETDDEISVRTNNRILNCTVKTIEFTDRK